MERPGGEDKAMIGLSARRNVAAAVLAVAACLVTGPLSAQTGQPLSPAAAAQFEIRLQQLEQEVRALTGMIEELSFNVRRLEGQFERNQADLEMRLQPGTGGSSNENLAADAALPAPTARAVIPEPSAAPPQIVTPQGVTLGAAPNNPANSTTVTAAPTLTVTPPASGGSATVLPQGAPAEDYNNAYALLQQADYGGAERAFGSFLATYPSDPLAGNAQYWLAETFYVRENYHQAAVQFAEGYKNYPTGPKAAANLLKLGMSLGRLGKNREACASLDELDRRFPDAPGNVQQYARTERQRLGCG
ncbi:MAG: tol-pal system protein YbgF [Alphaproteobacteria bacterium]|nr:tol-pal system protein YbgF [Alphaproteobacteria bacterium]